MSLFRNTEELRTIVPVTKSFTFTALRPYLVEAAEQMLVPYVGDELYERALNIREQAEPASKPEDTLLRRLQTIEAKFGLLAYLPFGEVQLGDDGLSTIGKSESRTAAYDHQVVRLSDSLARQGFDALERLLAWLQQDAQLTEFPEYADSDAYTRSQQGLVRSATEFSDIYPIAGSRMTFQAIQPELLNVEEDRLIPLITPALYDIIHANANLVDLHRSLRLAARKAVVFQAVANVIQLQQNVQLDASGLRIYGITPSGGSNVRYYQPPTDTQRAQAVAAAQARADIYWDTVSSLSGEIINPDDDDFLGEIITTGPVTLL